MSPVKPPRWPRLSHWSTTPLTSVHSTDADRRREIRGEPAEPAEPAEERTEARA